MEIDPSCPICFEKYNKEQLRAFTASCGHSICSLCKAKNQEDFFKKGIPAECWTCKKTFDGPLYPTYALESATATGEPDAPINDPSTFRFYHPSGLFLNQSCERLGITYSAEACVFLANIRIYDFNLNSSPREVFQISDAEMSGFSALSLLLTGSEEFGIQIKCSLNTYILQNCDAIGQLVGHDLSRCNNPKVIQNSSANNPTEIHFVAMAHMLNCRFVIYKNGGYKRYGNWSPSPEYRPLFLLQFANGKYSPILSF